MKASIIIPVFNDGSVISKTLDAILNQNYSFDDYEIIIVDNGSNEKIEKVISNFPQIHFICEHNYLNSPYSARNRGIEIAKGEIIVLLDATCTPSNENWLSKGMQKIIEENADIVAGNVQFDFEGHRTISKIYDSIMNIKMKESVRKNIAKTANLFIKRDVFRKIGYFPEGIRSGGDIRWTYNATSKGCILVYSEEASVKKVARSFIELIKKQWRIGLGQPEIWYEKDGMKKVFFGCLIKIFPMPLGKLKNAIKERGTNDMYKYLLHLFLLSYLIKITMLLANLRGVFLLFNKKKMIQSR